MTKWPLYLASAALGTSLLAANSRAQTTSPPILVPRDWPRPRPLFPVPFPAPLTELQLVSQSAKVEIRGVLARTHLTQKLRNPTDRALEGSYVFALPKGAAVSNFAMTMGGKRLEAEVLEGDQAREIYTGIVRKMRDPAILEFLDRDLVRAKIFPVPPGDSVEIEVDYAQTVTQGYSLPLRAPSSLGGGLGAPSSVDISLQIPDLRAVYSPSHSVETTRRDGLTRVTGEFSGADRDFSLLWTRTAASVGLDLLTSPGENGEDGTFLLLAAPDPTLAAPQIEAKDVVFVFDTSGSMEGPKIEQARRALKTLLNTLGPKDRFNIVTFASGTQNFRDALVPATPANLGAARGFADEIRALGGTNISDALDVALKMTGETGAAQAGAAKARPRQIVFMTDGQPTVGQTDPNAILRDVKAESPDVRLFSFGVGTDVNARLLDSLAEDHHGASDYVLPSEDIEVKVGALGEKIAYPVLSGGKIDFGGLNVYDVYPPQLPDLFRGAQATVFGRYKGAASGKISLSGQQNGRLVRFGGSLSSANAPELPKLWATRKVGFLLDDARRASRPVEGEVRDEIIKLSRKYGIVTPLTAALITEDGAPPTRRDGVPILGNIPIPGGVFRSPGGFGGRGGNASGGFGGNGGGFGGGLPANVPAPARAQAGLSSRAGFADTGAAGVATSQAAKSLREGRAEADSGVKTVEGKTFTLKDGVWTDAEFDAKKNLAPRVVKFASTEYFELLRDAKLAKWLSVGDRVVIVWKGAILKIEL